MLFKLVLVILSCTLCFASHGRYGTIHFTKDVSDPQSVTITFDASFRRSYFGAPNLNDIVTDDQFCFGDGSCLVIPMTVTLVDTALDRIVIKWVGTHRFAGAGDYLIGWQSCCRIFALNNNPSYSYAHTALVHLLATEISKQIPINNSPSSTFPAILTVPYSVVPYQYPVLASDPESDALTFVQATPTQQGDPASTQPTGMSLTLNGQATLSSVLAHGYWTTQQIITDSFGNWISLDYLLDVEDPILVCSGCINSNNPACTTDNDCASLCVNSTCVQPQPRMITTLDTPGAPTPNTDHPSPNNGDTYNLIEGDTIVLNYVADDSRIFHPSTGVTISFGSTPPGAIMSIQTDCDTAHSCICNGCNDHASFRTLTWTAPPGSAGTTNIVCVTVDSRGNPIPAPNNPWCVSINVDALPLTTQPLTTASLTTSFLTVADRCATLSFPETQGFFCAADGSGYYQCLKGPYATMSANRPCAPGTSCKCPYGVECTPYGLCTYGSFNGPYTWTTGITA